MLFLKITSFLDISFSTLLFASLLRPDLDMVILQPVIFSRGSNFISIINTLWIGLVVTVVLMDIMVLSLHLLATAVAQCLVTHKIKFICEEYGKVDNL